MAQMTQITQRMSLLLVVSALLSSLINLAEAFGEANRFLIVTSPSTKKIAYHRLPEGGVAVPGSAMRTLIDTGLRVPQGIDIDQYRKRLYVADPDLGKLVGYPITTSGDTLTAGAQFTVANGVEARWVAVDGLGNVYFTDEPNNRILRVTAKMIEDGTTTPEIVYDGKVISVVSAPGGIAVDNFFSYWLNKAGGMQVGSLVRGSEVSFNASTAGAGRSVTTLASNVDKSYGVCIALKNIFYTDESNKLYGVKRFGGEPATISSDFQEPRGCAFDGDGTVYIADKAKNAVYQIPSNMQVLGAAPVSKAVELSGAYGVAVYIQVL